MASMLFWLGFVPGVSAEAAKCGFQAGTDCYGNDIGGVTNKTEFMTPQACCLLCSKTASVRYWLECMALCLSCVNVSAAYYMYVYSIELLSQRRGTDLNAVTLCFLSK